MALINYRAFLFPAGHDELELDGIDLSYYTDTDTTTGEVAIFMKKKLN